MRASQTSPTELSGSVRCRNFLKQYMLEVGTSASVTGMSTTCSLSFMANRDLLIKVVLKCSCFAMFLDAPVPQLYRDAYQL